MKKTLINLRPCTVCGSTDINWSNDCYYPALQCNCCGFKVYPEDAYASEDAYFDEWNLLNAENPFSPDDVSYTQWDNLCALNSAITTTAKLIEHAEKNGDEKLATGLRYQFVHYNDERRRALEARDLYNVG